MKKTTPILLALFATLTLAAGNETYPPAGQRATSPGNTTYHIDPINGNDASSGKRKTSAWRTFDPINHLLLAPGDRVKIASSGSFNQTLVLMGTGTAKAPIEIHFAPGRHHFHPDQALRRKYQISNTNDEPNTGKAIGILLEEAQHFKLSGPGAHLDYHGKMIEICIDRCENILISDLQFDYPRPTVSEFRISSVGADYVDLKIHKDSSYKIEKGGILWIGDGWSFRSGLAQELDLDRNEVWRRRDPLRGMQLTEIEPFLVRARGTHDMKPNRVYQIRNTRRDCAGALTRRSKNIVWKNVQFHFLHGMGIVNQFSENIAFDTVSIAPEKESGRTCAAWADCIQVSGCKGKLIIKNCTFSGANDDAVNIHGTHLRVVEQRSKNQIKVRFMHNQTFGFMAFNPGDEVTFVRSDSLETYGPNKVEKAELLDPKNMLLTLERSVPSKFKENDVLENTTWTPEVEIRGCTVSRIPTRGFLITTRRKVLVTDNTFNHIHGSAILLENDARGWYESGCVRDMTIQDNHFIQCGEPVININPQNNVPNDSVHQNIRIENNTFMLRKKTAIRAKSTQGLKIAGNTIHSDPKLSPGKTIQTHDCSNIRIKSNRFKKLPK